MRFAVAILLAVSISPCAATAQSPTLTFADLARSATLGSGDDVMITFVLDERSAAQRFPATLLSIDTGAIRVEIKTDLAALGTDLAIEVIPASTSGGPPPNTIVEIPSERVVRITTIDSRTNGILLGTVVGAGSVGVLAGSYCLADEDGCVNGGNLAAGAIAAGAAIGAGIGFLVDQFAKGEGEVLYEAPGSARRVTYAFAPMLSQRSKGAHLVISW